ncbi:A/G-specific adenine glycosylase [Carboxylicivirga sp. N1Y90]|uniref:A/G-specific adenine glycosylase n=1 Tax=Carboxylicivirga fragile TaxID=3417571 RepID=UPI003D33D61A|nr:A/G-specific adenine glycosylase [Marinilabiliaceae bacterium N1Y90]
MDFRKQLIDWYLAMHRPLPWRQTNDPYKIWISEIILQQTQVIQGTAYYHRFIDTFPNVQELAKANEDKVLKLWEGLGYYSRARNLHTAAKMIVADFNGIFPNDYKSIISLKGIGPYTAAAIASFAFKLPYAVIDGNVYRFISRLHGITTPIDTTEGKKLFEQKASELLNPKQPDLHNQAMMEMGATVCKATAPLCNDCVFNKECVAYQTGQHLELPIKIKKVKQRHRYFNYFLINNEEGIILNQRTKSDIWQKLYELPLFESSKKLSASQLKKDFQESFKMIAEIKHILSHQIIHARFFRTNIKILDKIPNKGMTFFNTHKHKDYAFPQLIVNFLNEQDLPIR